MSEHDNTYHVTLPWPPSSNHYWVRTRYGGVAVGKRGRQFRRDVASVLSMCRPIDGRVAVEITAHAPDRRKRDLDNLLKATLDACNKILWHDDCQIDSLRIERGALDRQNPRLTVTAWAMGGGDHGSK